MTVCVSDEAILTHDASFAIYAVNHESQSYNDTYKQSKVTP